MRLCTQIHGLVCTGVSPYCSEPKSWFHKLPICARVSGWLSHTPSAGMVNDINYLFLLYFYRKTNQALIYFLEFPNVACRGFVKHHGTNPSEGTWFEQVQLEWPILSYWAGGKIKSRSLSLEVQQPMPYMQPRTYTRTHTHGGSQ